MDINDFETKEAKKLFVALALIYGEVTLLRRTVRIMSIILILISMILFRISYILG